MSDPTALPPPPGSDPATAPLYLTMSGQVQAGIDPQDPQDPDGLGHGLPLRDRVQAALQQESVQATLDEDGDLGLVLHDQMLFLRCVETVPPMVRIFGQWVLDGAEATELTWLRAGNAVTGAVNLVKASVHGDRLVIAIDLVVAGGLPLGPVLVAGLQAVVDAAGTWRETVEQLTLRGLGAAWAGDHG